MARLRFPSPPAGAQALPSAVLPFDIGVTYSSLSHPGLPVTSCLLPGERGVVFANGYDKLRHVIDETILDTGGLAPNTAPTVTPTGNLASATLDLDDDGPGGAAEYTIVDGDKLIIYSDTTVEGIEFKTTLSASRPTTGGTFGEVLIGASNSIALDNMQAYVEDGDGEGTVYWHHADILTALPSAVMSVSAKTDSTITLAAKDYGTGGNLLVAYLYLNWGANVSFGSQGTTIGTTGYFEGGTAGTGSAPEAGKYRYFYTYYRSIDGAETGPSPVTTTQTGAAMEIDVDDLVASADTTFDFVRIYRTEDTGAEFFPVKDIPRALAASPDFTDDTPNGEDDGSLQGYGVVAYNEELFLDYRGGFPPRVRCVALWKNRVWGVGVCLAADYSSGTAWVTADSDAVTLSAAAVPTGEMVGNTFRVDDDAESYTVLVVDESTRVLTLDRGYEGTTDAIAEYTLKDNRDGSQIWCSEAGLPNQWPTKNNPGSVDQDGDDEGGTGMVAMDDALIVFSRTTMYRVTGDDIFSWQVHRVPGGVGCLAQATIQKVRVAGQSGIMWLSPDGVFFYGGGGSPMDLSLNTPESGISDTLERISLPHGHMAHAYYSQPDRVWRCFAPMDGSPTPKDALVFDLLRRDFAGPDKAPHYTHSAAMIDGVGDRYIMAGDRFGGLWQLDVGTSDGGYGAYEPVQAIETGATTRTLARKTGTDWPTTGEGLDGVPALILYCDGSYAYTVMVSNTDNDLVFAEDLAVAPSENDQVIVGSIHAIAESGRGFLADLSMEKPKWSRFILLHSPESGGEVHPSFAGDQDSLDMVKSEDNDSIVCDLSDQTGRTQYSLGKRRMMGKFALSAILPGSSVAILGYGLDLTQRSSR